MITPTDAQCAGASIHRHFHIAAGVADHRRRFSDRARISHRLFNHGRLRLGWVPVSRLQCDEEDGPHMSCETQTKPDVRLHRLPAHPLDLAIPQTRPAGIYHPHPPLPTPLPNRPHTTT